LLGDSEPAGDGGFLQCIQPSAGPCPEFNDRITGSEPAGQRTPDNSAFGPIELVAGGSFRHVRKQPRQQCAAGAFHFSAFLVRPLIPSLRGTFHSTVISSRWR